MGWAIFWAIFSQTHLVTLRTIQKYVAAKFAESAKKSG
jgi:hypothetical protein